MGKTRPGSWVFGGGLFGLFDFHEGGRLLGLLLLGNDGVGENKVVVVVILLLDIRRLTGGRHGLPAVLPPL